MDLGSRIVIARRAKGWTSSRLAEEVGLSRQQLSRIEHGHSEPTAPTLERIRLALGADLDATEGDLSVPRTRAVDVLWDRLSHSDQREILDLMAARVARSDERSFEPADEALALAAR